MVSCGRHGPDLLQVLQDPWAGIADATLKDGYA
jgi:hypothetical protein